MDFGKSIEPIKQFAISNAKAIIWLLDYLCRMENVLMNVIVSVVANHEEYEICISKDLHFCPDRRSGIIETGQSAIPTLSWILTVFSIFLATTRSCESTSRRKSTARSPSRTPPRLLPPASPPQPRGRPSPPSPATPAFLTPRFYPFSSGRFISTGGARFRAHKSPRARNRKHPRRSSSISSSSSSSRDSPPHLPPFPFPVPCFSCLEGARAGGGRKFRTNLHVALLTISSFPVRTPASSRLSIKEMTLNNASSSLVRVRDTFNNAAADCRICNATGLLSIAFAKLSILLHGFCKAVLRDL